MKKYIYILPLLAVFACDLQKEVDLNLPEYEPQIVVESYLQPGQPYVVTLLESTPFFDEVEINFIRDAEVVIFHGDQADTLTPLEIPLNFAFPPGFVDTALLSLLGPLLGEGAYFYTSFNPVPADYENEFRLEVKLLDGRELSARTLIPEPVETEFEYRFNEDSLALVLTKIPDNANEINFYRRLLEEVVVDTLVSEEGDTSLNSRIRTVQDFIADDALSNGQLITFGTFNDYAVGDTVISTVYSITQEFFRFSETRDAAIIASFSPFAPPTVVFSNIEGGTGIFTGFTFDQKTLVIE